MISHKESQFRKFKQRQETPVDMSCLVFRAKHLKDITRQAMGWRPWMHVIIERKSAQFARDLEYAALFWGER